MDGRSLLVGPDVQGAYDHPLAAHGGGDILVGLELLLLGGVVAGRQIQKLRAEQADALAVVGFCGLGEALKAEFSGRQVYIDGETGQVAIEPDEITLRLLRMRRVTSLMSAARACI